MAAANAKNGLSSFTVFNVLVFTSNCCAKSENVVAILFVGVNIKIH